MLFLLQSRGSKYGRPPTPLLRKEDAKAAAVVAVNDDDELLMIWYTFLARYYAKHPD